ncbi:hypothetical protein CVT24_009404 [Panaeolus cyanescens]|uniref:HMG box domain-containing protein n=1 Tax=Panaeolus cyanescens TaxID=181874 RepID=A0A409WEN4_9AGAR|nr:hypothetical protein CVT24_009404 [Panaeolus cyanescens]
MPPARLSRRRRSSHAIFTPARPGTYGIPASARPVQFAPNVTPVTYTDPEEDDIDALAAAVSSGSLDPSALDSLSLSLDDNSSLFPPLENPTQQPTRKRCPPGKRRSQGYIPRPPNAFMLFRADFVKQKHVPGSIETNHGSLSKIIGTCWHNLPDSERRVWQNRAKIEKAKHKAQYPDYRFRPVHNKEKKAAAAAARAEADARTSSCSVNLTKHKQFADDEDERRCEDISQLLLSGKKGEELALAMKELDRQRERDTSASVYGSRDVSRAQTPSSGGVGLLPQVQHVTHVVAPQPVFNPNAFGGNGWASGFAMHRRSSSVPLPGDFSFGGMGGAGIALPSIPPLGFHSRPSSPLRISNQHFNAPTPFNNGFSNLPSSNSSSSFTTLNSNTSTLPSSTLSNLSSTLNNNNSRSLLGLRRPSSAQAILRRSWTMPGFEAFDNSAYMPHPAGYEEGVGMMPFDLNMNMGFGGMMGMNGIGAGMNGMGGGMNGMGGVFGGVGVDMNSYPDDEPLPEPETSLFESGFSLSGSNSSNTSASGGNGTASECPLSSPKVDQGVDPAAPISMPITQGVGMGMSPMHTPLDAVSPLTCDGSSAGTPVAGSVDEGSLDSIDPSMFGAHGMDGAHGLNGMGSYDTMTSGVGYGYHDVNVGVGGYGSEMGMGMEQYVC